MNDGWVSGRLGDVLQKTETVDPRKFPQKEFSYIDVSSVNNRTFSIESVSVLRGSEAPSRARKLVRSNDVIFATVRPTLRRIAIVPESYDREVCSTGYFVLRGKEFINNRFLYYYLLSDGFDRRMEKLQKGASYPAVTDGEVREQPFTYPPIAEQKRIVEILDEAFEAIDKAKQNAEKNLQNARELFESHLQSVFVQRGDGWVEKELSEIAQLIDSLHKTPSYISTGGFPMVRVTDVSDGVLNLKNCKRVDEQVFDEFSRRHTPRIGDIVLSRVGSYGVPALVETTELFCLGQNTVFILTDINSRFLYHFLRSPNSREQIDKMVSGTTQPTISLKSIKQIVIPVPSETEQNRVVDKIDVVYAETQCLESVYRRKLAALDELKKSMLHRAFSGNL